MGKKVFWVFIASVFIVSATIVSYFQSDYFAGRAKTRINEFLISEVGIELEFTNFKLKAFPPGIALVNPNIKVLRDDNELEIPVNTVFQAKELGVVFKMIQTFSKQITINVISLIDARVKIDLSKVTKMQGIKSTPSSADFLDFLSRPIEFNLSKRLSFLIKQVEIRDSLILVNFLDENDELSTFSIDEIKLFSVKPLKGKYSVVFDLNKIFAKTSKVKESVDLLRANIEIAKSKVTINSLDIKQFENSAHISGEINGDLRQAKKLNYNLSIIARSTSEGIDRFVPGFFETRGRWLIEGSLKGPISKLSFFGNIELKDFSYKKLFFNFLKAKVNFDNEILELKNLNLVKDNGSMNLSSFLIDFKESEIKGNTKVTFKDFDLQSIIGSLTNEVQNVEAVIDGELTATYGLLKENDSYNLDFLKVNTDLFLDYFELNNKKHYAPNRKVKKILSFENSKFNSVFEYRNQELNIVSAKVDIADSIIDIKGGYKKETGLNIDAKTDNITLEKAFGRVAEIPIYGKGSVSLRVTSPENELKLGFQLNLIDSEYINIFFGALKGEVEYHDKSNTISINDVSGDIRSSLYKGSGYVTVGQKENLELNLKLIKVQPTDLYFAFKESLSKISWVPNDITGWINGSVKISGSYTDIKNGFNVKGSVVGDRLHYRGEVFSDLDSDFSYIDGAYKVTNASIKKYGSLASGWVSFSKDDFISYEANVKSGSLRDFNFLSSAEFPIEGKYVLNAQGKGKIDHLESALDFKLFNAHMRNQAINDLSIRLTSGYDSIETKGNFGQLDFVMKVFRPSYKGEEESVLSIRNKDQDLSFLLCGLNDRLCEKSRPFFRPRAELLAKWNKYNWQTMTGRAVIEPFKLGVEENYLNLREGLIIDLNKGFISAAQSRVTGKKNDFNISANGRVDFEKFNLSLAGNLDLRLIQLFTSEIENSEGLLSANIQAALNNERLNFNGSISMEEGSLKVASLNTKANDINAFIILKNNEFKIERLMGIFGGGPMKTSGSIYFFPHKVPSFDIALDFKDSRVQFFPVSFADIESADISFKGAKIPYELSGNVKVKEALIKRNFDVSEQEKRVRYAKYLPKKSTYVAKFYKVNLYAEADDKVFVKNDLLDAEFKGNLRLLNNFEFPQIVGEMELVSGQLLFRYNTFELSYLTLKLVDPENFEPQFSLSGESQLAGYKINLFASGTSSEPKINFSSSPPLPQEDVLSLLAFGFRGNERSSVNPDEVNRLTYTNVGSILLDQLKLSRNLESQGLRVNVTPHVSDNPANTLKQSPDQTSSVSPKVTLRKKISDKIDASAASTFGSEQNQKVDLNLEYHLKDGVSVQGVYEQESGVEPDEVRSSVGADLKFKWEFE